MLLSLEQIKSVTFGACDVWEENGQIKFSRFIKKQYDAWESKNVLAGTRATTAIKLDFHSNTKKVSVSAVSIKSKYEIYIDDEPVYFGRITPTAPTISLGLDGNEHRITIMLPCHGIGVLTSVEIDDGASLIPHQYDYKFMFWGDSLTQGWNSEQDSLSYANRVARHFNAEVVNLAVGGTVFNADVVCDEHPFDPEYVILAYGTNDWNKTTFSELEANCKNFLDNVTKVYKGKTIIGITPIWRWDVDEIKMAGSFNDVVSLLKKEYLERGIKVVEGIDLVPHQMHYYSDAVHLNAKGFGLYAKNLIPKLEEIILEK